MTTKTDMNWSLKLDYSNLDTGAKRASSAFKSIKTASNSTQKDLSRMDRQMNKTGDVAKKTGSTIKRAFLGLTSLIGISAVFSKISGSMDGAISRLDTLSNYEKVMSNLGISSRDAQKSIAYLSDKLTGLPTALDDAVSSVQRFTSANGDVLASTELFLALNNAVLAGGAGADIQKSAIEQLSQAYSKGRPDMMEWRSAMTAMPAQMKQVATAMGFINADALGESLRSGKTSMNDFMITIAKLNKEGVDGFQNFEQQARNATGGIATSMANVRTAMQRALADIMKAIGQANIASFFNAITKAIGTATNYIVAFIKVMQMAFNWVSALFGKGSKQSSDMNNDIKGATSGVNGLSKGIEGSNKALDGTAKSAKKANKELGNMNRLGIDALNISKDTASAGSDAGAIDTGGAGAFGGLGDLGKLIPEIDTSSIDKATQMAEAFKKKWLEVKDVIVNNKVPIVSTIAGIGGSLGALGVIKAIPSIKQLFTTIGGGLSIFKLWVGEMGLVKGSIDLLATAVGTTSLTIAGIVGIVGLVAGALAQLWQTNDKFKESVIQSWNGIKKVVNAVWESYLKPIFESIKTALNNIWNLGLKPLWDGWVDFVGSISNAMMELWNGVLQPVAMWFIKTFSPIITTALDGVMRVFAFVTSTIGQYMGALLKQISFIVDMVVDVFKGVTTFLSGVFTGDWKKAFEGIKDIFGGVAKFLEKTWQNTWNFITGLFKTGGKIFDGFVDGVFGVFKTLVNHIISGINSVISMPFKKLKGLLSDIKGISILGAKPFNFINPNIIPIPQIPKFADGGIVSGRIIGEMAEYEGASRNPEVIAPLDRLKTLIPQESNLEMIAELRTQNELLRRIADKDTTVVMDKRKVGDVIDEAKRLRDRQKGMATV